MDAPQFYAAVNANDNITHRLQTLGRALICNQGKEDEIRAIMTEILILVGIDTIVMLAFRETLPKPESEDTSS